MEKLNRKSQSNINEVHNENIDETSSSSSSESSPESIEVKTL